MYAMNFAQVGKNISNVMTQRGMTQQNLADKLGISKQVMSKIIKGNKAINVTELSQIASILGSTTDSLLTVESNTITREPGLAFMGMIKDEETQTKVELLRNAIDQIRLLEELAND
ncbi:anaerobic benzoate catabolism transcriptional regulator [Peptococcaceae bacterium CEB3]|nr:anaerobic benzoate catabolism transcriptional regulator [Peptococcaceae bacterium CEB3]